MPSTESANTSLGAFHRVNMHICAIQKALEKVVQCLWHEGEVQYYYVRCGRDDHIRYTDPLLTRYPLSEVYCNVMTDRNRVYRS